MARFDITLVIPGIPFTGETFDKLSIGGSESAGFYMARALEALGHRVNVFTNTDKTSRSGEVYYMPLAMFRQYAEFTPHDVLIIQRAPELFSTQNLSRFSALWCHDLGLLRAADKVRGVAWNYNKVFVLSQFMYDQYKEIYGLPEELLYLTRNGVDLATVEAARTALITEAAHAGRPTVGIERDPFQLCYSARPERGADVLFGEIMPRILALEPRAHLACSTYYNPVEHLQEYYQQCSQLAARLGDRVRFVGNLNKHDLYKLYLQSGLYVYPVPAKYAPDFDEISCISALEAQACGLPMISSKRGALPETLAADAGVLIDEPIHTEAYYEEFAHQAVRLMLDREAWQQASDAGMAAAPAWTWDAVAQQWTDMFEEEIRARSRNSVSLANHFWRHSDIFAAKEVIRREREKGELPPILADVARKVERDWAFVDEEDGFHKQYERIGATHDPDVINWVSAEPRYLVMREWLRKYGHEVSTLLDYGCAHGAYAINLLREHDGLSIVGVDIDNHGIALANQFAERFGILAPRWRGVVGDWKVLERVSAMEGELLSPSDGRPTDLFDCAVAQEVLEHVPEPWEVLKALEAKVRDGGYVYITVPFGPWEYTDYRRYPYRAHVWEFDLHDIYDMLGDKQGSEVTINAMPAPEPIHHNPYTGEPMGWWVIMYRVTAETRGKVGKIDMERKLWCQRPRQTVSACIIAGDRSREALLWCLDSLEHVVDELVLVDCGMSEADRAVLSLSMLSLDGRLKLIQGVDPKTEGFETPRNMGLGHCTGDWVLWVDTDEKLLQPEAVAKYLRDNIFEGYSIRQHHFTVDTNFEADMPVRFFRNPNITGSGMRWFGMIHEHPEHALNTGPGRTIVLGDIHIPHMGYLIESGRKQRFARNLPMLVKDSEKYPDRILQKHFIMRDNMLLCTYELRANGGVVTDAIKARAWQTVNLWREHFKGKQHFSNIDPITYYGQANQLLGHGFDFYLSMAADKIDAKPNGGLKIRFADMDDLMVEVERRAKDAAQPYMNPHY